MLPSLSDIQYKFCGTFENEQLLQDHECYIFCPERSAHNVQGEPAPRLFSG